MQSLVLMRRVKIAKLEPAELDRFDIARFGLGCRIGRCELDRHNFPVVDMPLGESGWFLWEQCWAM